MSTYLRAAIIGTACLGFICLCAPTSKAQVAEPNFTRSQR